MADFKTNLQKMLRNVRMACGYKQHDVADIIGVNRSTYSYYETGKTSPDIPTLHKLAILYSIPVETFLYPEKYTDMAIEKIRIKDVKKRLPEPQRIGELTKEEKLLIGAYRSGKIKISTLDPQPTR